MKAVGGSCGCLVDDDMFSYDANHWLFVLFYHWSGVVYFVIEASRIEFNVLRTDNFTPVLGVPIKGK